MLIILTTISTMLINVSRKYQTMEGFAASDAWFENNVGKFWEESEKEDIARLLFSTEIKDHQPQGIGLTMWRFNVGACTAEQGDKSDITDFNHRAEGFMNDRLQYDFDTKQLGQIYFLEKAYNYGCRSIVLFSNSPPVYYTKNGKGHSDSGETSNLKPEYYQSFAQYLTDAAYFFEKKKGIKIDYISPVNEPQWNWNDQKQEGSPWQNKEVANLVRILDSEIESRGLDTKIMIAEAADWTYTYDGSGDQNRRNVMDNFFNPKNTETYVGDLKHVPKMIGAHSYWTDVSWDKLTTTRQKVHNKAQELGLSVFQTEWSMLSSSYDKDEFPGFDKATEIDVALYMTKVIHIDLTVANMASWSFWTSLDHADDKGRYHLVRLFYDDSGDVHISGSHEASKTLWVLGQFSRFIPIGYKRVDAKLDNSDKYFFGSAYISQDEKEIVAVFTNCKDDAVNIDFKFLGIDGKTVKSVKSYTTSNTDNLFERIIENIDDVTLQGKSVTTFVFTLE